MDVAEESLTVEVQTSQLWLLCFEKIECVNSKPDVVGHWRFWETGGF